MEWPDRARGQDGVLSRAQLFSFGVAEDVVDRMVQSAQLCVLTRGVYLVRGAPLTYRARLWAAVLSTDGALGFATAAELWACTGRRDDQIHIVLPHSRRVYPPPWVRLHRVPLAADHRVEIDELPITSRPWTLCDYVPTLPGGRSIQLADRALQQGWLTPIDIEHRLKGYPRRRGNTRLRQLLAITSDGAASEAERVLHKLLRRAGIKNWRANHRIWIDGELFVADVAIEEHHVVIEVDGMAYHVDADRFQHDRTRQNTLTTAGWTVLRFTWNDLTNRPEYVINKLRQAVAGSLYRGERGQDSPERDGWLGGAG
jgi:very-short-patch-repair endonuclease